MSSIFQRRRNISATITPKNENDINEKEIVTSIRREIKKKTFKNDHIKLSSLSKIVWAMGSSIEFVITPKTQAPSTQNMRVARTTIQFIEDQNIEYIDPDESKLQLKLDKKIQSQQAR